MRYINAKSSNLIVKTISSVSLATIFTLAKLVDYF